MTQSKNGPKNHPFFLINYLSLFLFTFIFSCFFHSPQSLWLIFCVCAQQLCFCLCFSLTLFSLWFHLSVGFDHDNPTAFGVTLHVGLKIQHENSWNTQHTGAGVWLRHQGPWCPGAHCGSTTWNEATSEWTQYLCLTRGMGTQGSWGNSLRQTNLVMKSWVDTWCILGFFE